MVSGGRLSLWLAFLLLNTLAAGTAWDEEDAGGSGGAASSSDNHASPPATSQQPGRHFTQAEIAQHMALAWDEEISVSLQFVNETPMPLEALLPETPPPCDIPLPFAVQLRHSQDDFVATSTSSLSGETGGTDINIVVGDSSREAQPCPLPRGGPLAQGETDGVLPPQDEVCGEPVQDEVRGELANPVSTSENWLEAIRDTRNLRALNTAVSKPVEEVDEEVTEEQSSTPWWIAIQDTRGINELRRQRRDAALETPPTCARDPTSLMTTTRRKPVQDWDGWMAEVTSDEEPGVTQRGHKWRVGRDRWHRPDGSIIVRQRDRLQAEMEAGKMDTSSSSSSSWSAPASSASPSTSVHHAAQVHQQGRGLELGTIDEEQLAGDGEHHMQEEADDLPLQPTSYYSSISAIPQRDLGDLSTTASDSACSSAPGTTNSSSSSHSVGFWKDGVWHARPRTMAEQKSHNGGQGAQRTLRRQQRVEQWKAGLWKPAWLVQYGRDRLARETANHVSPSAATPPQEQRGAPEQSPLAPSWQEHEVSTPGGLANTDPWTTASGTWEPQSHQQEHGDARWFADSWWNWSQQGWWWTASSTTTTAPPRSSSSMSSSATSLTRSSSTTSSTSTSWWTTSTTSLSSSSSPTTTWSSSLSLTSTARTTSGSATSLTRSSSTSSSTLSSRPTTSNTLSPTSSTTTWSLGEEVVPNAGLFPEVRDVPHQGEPEEEDEDVNMMQMTNSERASLQEAGVPEHVLQRIEAFLESLQAHQDAERGGEARWALARMIRRADEGLEAVENLIRILTRRLRIQGYLPVQRLPLSPTAQNCLFAWAGQLTTALLHTLEHHLMEPLQNTERSSSPQFLPESPSSTSVRVSVAVASSSGDDATESAPASGDTASEPASSSTNTSSHAQTNRSRSPRREASVGRSGCPNSSALSTPALPSWLQHLDPALLDGALQGIWREPEDAEHAMSTTSLASSSSSTTTMCWMSGNWWPTTWTSTTWTSTTSTTSSSSLVLPGDVVRDVVNLQLILAADSDRVEVLQRLLNQQRQLLHQLRLVGEALEEATTWLPVPSASHSFNGAAMAGLIAQAVQQEASFGSGPSSSTVPGVADTPTFLLMPNLPLTPQEIRNQFPTSTTDAQIVSYRRRLWRVHAGNVLNVSTPSTLEPDLVDPRPLYILQRDESVAVANLPSGPRPGMSRITRSGAYHRRRGRGPRRPPLLRERPPHRVHATADRSDGVDAAPVSPGARSRRDGVDEAPVSPGARSRSRDDSWGSDGSCDVGEQSEGEADRGHTCEGPQE